MAMDVVADADAGLKGLLESPKLSDNYNDYLDLAAELKGAQVNLLAVDFDCTLISTHTGGQWSYSCEELAAYVRDFFKLMIPAAIETGLHVAVVTFTPQTHLVHGVLKAAFGADVAAKIPVRGDDKSWEYRGDGVCCGKQGHMASAAEELMVMHDIHIERGTTLLVDDDISNVRLALEHGVRAILFKPDSPEDIARDIRFVCVNYKSMSSS